MATIPSTGFILINKPLKLSSHTVVSRLRKISGIKKIGHAGTLDPLATGLLILAIGREYTKKIDQYVKLDKEYVAEIFFGAESETYDREGEIKNTYSGTRIKKKIIRQALDKWQGEVKQVPPIFSAKKIKGQKLYNLARQGKEIEIPSHLVKISKIKILKYRWPILKIKISCGSGTYIRSLAHDLGRDLNCGAYLYSLSRTKIGKNKLSRAIKLDRLNIKILNKHLKNIL